MNHGVWEENAAWWEMVVNVFNVHTDVPPYSAFRFTSDLPVMSTLDPSDSAVGPHSFPPLRREETGVPGSRRLIPRERQS